MIVRKYWFITIGMIFLSCNSEFKDNKNEFFPGKVVILEDSINLLLDTTLNSGNRITFFLNTNKEDITAEISTFEWDTTFSVNEELAKDNSSMNPYNEIRIQWSTNQYAGIRLGCGSPCYYEVVFPFISGQRPRRFFFPYTNMDRGIQLAENLIAYNGDQNTPDGYPMIKIKNLLTQKMDSIPVLSNWSPRVGMNAFIDTLFATNNFIFIGQFDSSGYLLNQNSKKIELD